MAHKSRKKIRVLLLQNVIPPSGFLRHDLQTKLDAITEDTTARFMAKVARDMVQAGGLGQLAVAMAILVGNLLGCLEHSTLR